MRAFHFSLKTGLSILLVSGLLSVLHSVAHARPGETNFKQTNVIEGFRYSSCSAISCIEVTSPRAWVSLLNGGFSTDNPTIFKEFKRDGTLIRTFKGVSANLSPEIELLTVDQTENSFLLYSLKSEELSIFGSETNQSSQKKSNDSRGTK